MEAVIVVFVFFGFFFLKRLDIIGNNQKEFTVCFPGLRKDLLYPFSIKTGCPTSLNL